METSGVEFSARAICHRCGAPKKGPFVPCKSCEFVPQGDERAVAWLFGRDHLDEDDMTEAAARVRAGEIPDPSSALCEMAKEAMGAISLSQQQKRPLSPGQMLALVFGALFCSPLVGFAVWYGLREQRPIAARQSLRITILLSLVLFVVWVAVLLGRFNVQF